MTTKITITSSNPNHQDVAIAVVNPTDGSTVQTTTLTDGQSREFYLHDGAAVTCTEVAKPVGLRSLPELLMEDQDRRQIVTNLVTFSRMGYNGRVLPDAERQTYLDAIKSGTNIRLASGATRDQDDMKTMLIQDAYVRAGATCTWGAFQMDKLPWE